MTTRHVSAETDYPFQPELSVAGKLAAGGILDLYFVVQGPASRRETSSSSSSSGLEETDSGDHVQRYLYLRSYETLGSITRFGFDAVVMLPDGALDRWNIYFDVPNTGGMTGQVNNADDTDVSAVLIYNSDDIVNTGSGSTYLYVEQSRVQYHTEQVDTISFQNIARCAGSEDPDTVFDVLTLEASSSSSGEIYVDLAVEDGYNCSVTFEDSLVFSGELDVGKGISPNFGDTDPTCSEDPNDALEFVVTTINGIAPSDGDIQIDVSPGLGLQVSEGKLEITPRF